MTQVSSLRNCVDDGVIHLIKRVQQDLSRDKNDCFKLKFENKSELSIQ